MNRLEGSRRRHSTLWITPIAVALMIFCGQGQRAMAQWTNANVSGDINSTNTGNIGIGTPTPAAKLQVTTMGYGTYTDIGGSAATVGGVLIDQTVSSGSFTNPYRGVAIKTKVDMTSNLAFNVLSLHTETGIPSTNSANLSNLTIRGSNNVAYYAGTGSLGNMQGFFGTVIRDGSGAVTTASGVQTVIQNNNPTNAITTVYGLRVGSITNVGTITNMYGVHVGDISAGTITNTPFSFYASDPNAFNYFAGNVGIGTTAPTVKLDVAGQIRSSTGGFAFPDNTVQTTASQSFKNIANATGVTQFSAASINDSIRFVGTGGTTVSFDAATKKVIIDSSASGSTISAANVTAGQFGQGNYIFPGDVTVNGNIAAKYQDMAEWVPSRQKLAAGTVVILDPEHSNHVISSASAYDTRVAGVVSARPGLALGEGGEGKVLVATTGRVKVKVDATRAPIRIGDLLVTSDVVGMAMKSDPISVGGRQIHAPGTIIGKALEPLDQGVAEILVLLSMQ